MEGVVTGDEMMRRDAAARELAARGIMACPERFMVCEGCGSIVGRVWVGMCPACHAYRFDRRVRSVLEAAWELGRRRRRVVLGEDLCG